MMMRSGCSANARVTPGQPMRGFFGRSGRLGFCPFEGGVLELSGVFGGALSRASSAAMRAVNVPICAAWARTRATRSSLERARRLSRSTDTVNRTVRDRVEHNFGCRRSGYAQGGEQLLVSSGSRPIRPPGMPDVNMVIVAERADVADDRTAEQVSAAERCVTANTPLAARCLASGGRAFPHG